MASMSVRNQCSNCGKCFLASCESLCGECKKPDGVNALLSDVRTLTDKIKELEKDFNPYNVCDYERRLLSEIKYLTGKVREHFA